METKKCKNKKCQRPLPKEYKYKYCENCRNEQVNSVKKIIKNVGSGVLVLGAILTRNIKGKKFKKSGNV